MLLAVFGRSRQHSMLPLRKHHGLPRHAVAPQIGRPRVGSKKTKLLGKTCLQPTLVKRRLQCDLCGNLP